MTLPWKRHEVAVVIATFNENNVVSGCIKHLKEYTDPALSVEYILVDNRNKQHESVHLFNGELKCQYMEVVDSVFDVDKVVTVSHNAGCGRGWSIGALMSTAKYLIFCDDGVRARQDVISPLVSCMRDNSNCGMVGYNGGYRAYKDGDLILQEMPTPTSYPFKCDEVSGYLWGTPFEVFCEVGGVDPRFSPAGYEETDYAFKCRSKDFSVLRVPKRSTLRHVANSSARSFEISWLDLTEHTTQDIQKRNKQLFNVKWDGFPSVKPGV